MKLTVAKIKALRVLINDVVLDIDYYLGESFNKELLTKSRSLCAELMVVDDILKDINHILDERRLVTMSKCRTFGECRTDGKYFGGDYNCSTSVPDLIEVFKMAKIVCERRQRLNDTNDDSTEFNIAVMDLENATASLTTLIEKFEEIHGKVEAQ